MALIPMRPNCDLKPTGNFLHSPNEISEPKPNPFYKFLSYYWGPMPFLIWAAILIELIRLAPLNFFFLLTLQFANGCIWYYEERNSNEAIESLRSSLTPKAKVQRSGVWMTLESRDLVKGDKILVNPGDIIPADCLLAVGECFIDQSMLTGETEPILKTVGSILYMNSLCKKGEIQAYVVQIGKNTYFCKTTATAQTVNEKGRVQQVLIQVAFFLTVVSSILVSVVFVVLLAKGNEFLESLAISVVLLVISLPIAMQVVCATTLAVGSKALYHKHTLVSRLSAIEELAAMEVLCISKSALLNTQEFSIGTPVLFNSKNIEDLFIVALMASRKEKDSQDKIDQCICNYAFGTLQINCLRYEEENFEIFSSMTKKSMSSMRDTFTGEVLNCCKGSVNVVLGMVGNEEIKKEVSEIVKGLAEKGYSALAVAQSTQGKWELCGLIPIAAVIPLKTPEKVLKIQELHIKLTVLTGDLLKITQKLSIGLNLGDHIFNANILNHDNNTVQQEFIDSILVHADGYCEVFPEHKFTIVKMMQKKGKKIGITGNCISDAPALKRADVGLAEFGAIDAAMTAADIIYQKPGLKTITNSIITARKIFQKAETYCLYRIACSFQLLLFIFVGVVGVNPSQYHCSENSNCETRPNTVALPVLALVIIALLNDGSIIAIAYDSPSGHKQPSKWNLQVIFIVSCVLGAISLFTSLGFVFVALNHMNLQRPNLLLSNLNIPILTYGEVLNAVFLKVSVSNYLTIFSVRCRGFFLFNFPGKSVFIMGFVSLLVTTLVSKYWFLNLQPKNSVVIANLASLPWKLVFLIWFFDVVVFVLQDIIKISIYKVFTLNTSTTSDKVLTNLLFSTSHNPHFNSLLTNN